MPDYLDNLMPETTPLLKQLRAYAKKHDVPIITREGERFLNQLLVLKDAKNVLEIGAAIGYSAISMALNTKCHVTTIERDQAMVKQAKINISDANLDTHITVIEADALTLDVSELPMFDVLFIDAAKAQYIKFFEKYAPFVKPGGLIITDNLLFHGLIDQEVESRNLRQLLRKLDTFNQYILTRDDYITEIYRIGDGMSVSIKRK